MREFGFIVIAWASELGATYEPGDEVSQVWGTFVPPVPCQIAARSSRREFIKQNKFLVEKGAKFRRELTNPPAGWNYSRVVPQTAQAVPSSCSPDAKPDGAASLGGRTE